jgi:DNA-binding PadR family transcriptional regulator
VVGGKVRKYYTLTDAGQEALEQGRERAIELLDEIR